MRDSEDGYQFWKRVDSVRDPDKSLKELMLRAQLNYELVKVQRSLNRIPKAADVCRIAKTLDIPAEWLITGETSNIIDKMRLNKTQESQRVLTIAQKLLEIDHQEVSKIEAFLGCSTT